MDTYQHITRGFQQTIEAITNTVDPVAQPMQDATERLVTTLLNEGKVMCCGTGANACIAELLVSNLLHKFEQERPGLPAMSLCSGAATLAAATSTYTVNDIFSKQIRALGQAGDALVTVSNESSNSSIIQAISAAHERDMTVLSLTGGATVDISALLLPEDIELIACAERPPRITEIHVMFINQLCELVENALFGSYE